MTILKDGLRIPVTAIVPAAGMSKRMGGGAAKQFLPLRGEPVLRQTVQILSECKLVDEIVIAAHDLQRTAELVGGMPKVAHIVMGGKERQDSVWEGLRAVHARPRIVCVHDAARPLLTTALLEGILQAAALYPAQVVATPVKDTIKTAGPDGLVISTLNRSTLWAVQTPQVFWADVLVNAFRRAQEEGFVGTDCASLVERAGVPVRIFPGSSDNIKITTPDDLALAEAILARRMDDAN